MEENKIKNITEEILKNIIHIYALKICKLCDYYHEILEEINFKFENKEINKKEYKKRFTGDEKYLKLMKLHLVKNTMMDYAQGQNFINKYAR